MCRLFLANHSLFIMCNTLQNISAPSKWLFSAKLFVVRKWFNKTWTTLKIILNSFGVKLCRCLVKTFEDNITINQNIRMVDREFYSSTKFAFINWACFDLIWFNSWLTKKISNGNFLTFGHLDLAKRVQHTHQPTQQRMCTFRIFHMCVSTIPARNCDKMSSWNMLPMNISAAHELKRIPQKKVITI